MRRSREMLLILSPRAKLAPFPGYEMGVADTLGLPIHAALHHISLTEARSDPKWFEFVKDATFEMDAHLPDYLDELETRIHG